MSFLINYFMQLLLIFFQRIENHKHVNDGENLQYTSVLGFEKVLWVLKFLFSDYLSRDDHSLTLLDYRILGIDLAVLMTLVFKNISAYVVVNGSKLTVVAKHDPYIYLM